MTTIATYLQIFLVCVLALSIIVELHGYFVKSTYLLEGGAQALAFGNWIIYISRIFNMIFSFLLAIGLENGLELQLSVIFACGFFFGTILSILYVYSRRLEASISSLMSPILYISFDSFRGISFWRKTSATVTRRWIAMFTTAGLAYAALIIPFLIARMVPEYRMTSVYLGQALNFLSTIVLLGLLEPRLMASLDHAKKAEGFVRNVDGFIWSRVWLTGFLCLVCAGWFFLV